ncbi:MAG: PQQ-dependent sugar dehydrogenase, partial [Chloroflexota bacterium]|nr:PQQ-dependent sugar dehydrogenase [Chloroflexota bacterium]
GLRNTLGWGWHPETGELWGMDQGSDWRGDDQPPEELNNIVEGGNYGWALCFGDGETDVNCPYVPAGSTLDQKFELADVPALNYPVHSSPFSMVYYDGDQLPDDYRGDAFVAMRSSWNRDPVTGYKIVHVQFEDGQPVAIEDYITGWLVEDDAPHFGRVAGLAVPPDDSMLISEDSNGVIYRVTYTGD